jgi:hypothetical protein
MKEENCGGCNLISLDEPKLITTRGQNEFLM